MTPAELEAHLVRLTEAVTELRREIRDDLQVRVRSLETWAQDPSNPLPKTGTRLRELEVRQGELVREAVVELTKQIRSDPQLRELLRGPRGLAGEDGDPGPPGAAAATVIREVKISG